MKKLIGSRTYHSAEIGPAPTSWPVRRTCSPEEKITPNQVSRMSRDECSQALQVVWPYFAVPERHRLRRELWNELGFVDKRRRLKGIDERRRRGFHRRQDRWIAEFNAGDCSLASGHRHWSDDGCGISVRGGDVVGFQREIEPKISGDVGHHDL